jgi:hypothetical protein
MRATLAELMDALGVGYEIGAYETVPWSHYDSEQGITCSAEIRMSPDADEIEGEIQMMFDTPPEGQAPFENTCYLMAKPKSDKTWDIETFLIRGEAFEEEAYDHSKKAALFFSNVVRDLMASEIPDIDELLDEAFRKDERFAGKGSGGSKSPKLRGAQLMGMKKGSM